MVHPVQSVIESLYAAGRCPRLHVNAMHDGVECPAFIRKQWGERLIIDLDSSYPLDLTFQNGGLTADLSFGGQITRCMFPYGAIYVVEDRSTQRGIVLDQNVPESVKQARAAKPEPSESKPDLQPVSELVAVSDDDEPKVAKTADSDSVRRRRAGFRVIDGDGDGDS